MTQHLHLEPQIAIPMATAAELILAGSLTSRDLATQLAVAHLSTQLPDIGGGRYLIPGAALKKLLGERNRRSVDSEVGRVLRMRGSEWRFPDAICRGPSEPVSGGDAQRFRSSAGEATWCVDPLIRDRMSIHFAAGAWIWLPIEVLRAGGLATILLAMRSLACGPGTHEIDDLRAFAGLDEQPAALWSKRLQPAVIELNRLTNRLSVALEPVRTRIRHSAAHGRRQPPVTSYTLTVTINDAIKGGRLTTAGMSTPAFPRPQKPVDYETNVVRLPF